MRAARIVSPARFEITDDPIPDCPDGAVRVKLLKAAICGSDLPYFSVSYNPVSYPFPAGFPGHECLGVIEASRSSAWKEGDLVMYYPTGLDAYKEYHVNDPARVQKLPENSNLDLNVLLMTQLLGAVAHCVFRIDSPYNKNVVILGQGPVGQLFTSLIKNAGARSVITVDPLDTRLNISRQMGASHIVNPSTENVEERVKEITSGNMADIVIEAFGQNVDVINSSFDLARHNGQVAFFGICLDESPGLNFNVFFRKELRMIASVGPDLTMDYPYALDMILKGAVDVRPMLTHDMPFEEIQKGFDMAVARDDDAVKIVLSFQ